MWIVQHYSTVPPSSRLAQARSHGPGTGARVSNPSHAGVSQDSTGILLVTYHWSKQVTRPSPEPHRKAVLSYTATVMDVRSERLGSLIRSANHSISHRIKPKCLTTAHVIKLCWPLRCHFALLIVNFWGLAWSLAHNKCLITISSLSEWMKEMNEWMNEYNVVFFPWHELINYKLICPQNIQHDWIYFTSFQFQYIIDASRELPVRYDRH